MRLLFSHPNSDQDILFHIFTKSRWVAMVHLRGRESKNAKLDKPLAGVRLHLILNLLAQLQCDRLELVAESHMGGVHMWMRSGKELVMNEILVNADSPTSFPAGSGRKPAFPNLFGHWSAMPNLNELRPGEVLSNPRTDPAATAQPRSTIPPSRPVAGSKPSSLTEPTAPRHTEIPERYMRLEPNLPLSCVNDDPVFDARDAGKIVGVSVELLKKWRQRNNGPDYIQYYKNGPVRYEFSVLMAFRAAHRVCTGKVTS
jgi:hypothetical protein